VVQGRRPHRSPVRSPSAWGSSSSPPLRRRQPQRPVTGMGSLAIAGRSRCVTMHTGYPPAHLPTNVDELPSVVVYTSRAANRSPNSMNVGSEPRSAPDPQVAHCPGVPGFPYTWQPRSAARGPPVTWARYLCQFSGDCPSGVNRLGHQRSSAGPSSTSRHGYRWQRHLQLSPHFPGAPGPGRWTPLLT
jgi:hypothetical protein